MMMLNCDMAPDAGYKAMVMCFQWSLSCLKWYVNVYLGNNIMILIYWWQFWTLCGHNWKKCVKSSANFDLLGSIGWLSFPRRSWIVNACPKQPTILLWIASWFSVVMAVYLCIGDDRVWVILHVTHPCGCSWDVGIPLFSIVAGEGCSSVSSSSSWVRCVSV